MDKKSIMGRVNFIHHDKNYVTIEYTANGKKKTINGSIDEKAQLKYNPAKRQHSFQIGDEVSFVINPSPKGDRMIADNIEFKFNNTFSNIINKATIENKFTGYLKKVQDEYFIKEVASYILIPLILSPWEKTPHESRLNEPLFFKLNNISKPEQLTASLYKSEYYPEYMAAMKHFKNKTPVEAVVEKVTPFGVFISILNKRIKAKIPLKKMNIEKNYPNLKTGDSINVLITYLSPVKIVVEKA